MYCIFNFALIFCIFVPFVEAKMPVDGSFTKQMAKGRINHYSELYQNGTREFAYKYFDKIFRIIIDIPLNIQGLKASHVCSDLMLTIFLHDKNKNMWQCDFPGIFDNPIKMACQNLGKSNGTICSGRHQMNPPIFMRHVKSDDFLSTASSNWITILLGSILVILMIVVVIVGIYTWKKIITCKNDGKKEKLFPSRMPVKPENLHPLNIKMPKTIPPKETVISQNRIQEDTTSKNENPAKKENELKKIFNNETPNTCKKDINCKNSSEQISRNPSKNLNSTCEKKQTIDEIKPASAISAPVSPSNQPDDSDNKNGNQFNGTNPLNDKIPNPTIKNDVTQNETLSNIKDKDCTLLIDAAKNRNQAKDFAKGENESKKCINNVRPHYSPTIMNETSSNIVKDTDDEKYYTADADLKNVFKSYCGHGETSDLKMPKNLGEAFRKQNSVGKKENSGNEPLENKQLKDDKFKECEAKKQRLTAKRELLKYQVVKLTEPVKDVIRVSIHFPCGADFVCLFHTANSLEDLFNIVFAHEKCPEDFSIISKHSQRKLPCAPDWYKEFGTVAERTGGIETFKEAGIVTSIEVIIEDNQAQS